MLYLAADHRGFQLKELIKVYLHERAVEFEDLGNWNEVPGDDYPDIAVRVAEKLSEKPTMHRGIVICGSGVGVDIVANKFKGVRCGLGYVREEISAARKDDDINCLALGANFISLQVAERLVDAFLNTPFEPSERHTRRLKKITDLEKL